MTYDERLTAATKAIEDYKDSVCKAYYLEGEGRLTKAQLREVQTQFLALIADRNNVLARPYEEEA